MELKAILGRIEQRLRTLKLSADRAAALAGKPDAIRNMRRAVKEGRRGVSTATIDALAPVLKVSPAWLMGERPQPGRPHAKGGRAPLKGYVGAGAKAHFYAIADGDLDDVAAPEGSSDATVAVEIRGSSLGSLFDRWLAFYDDVRRPVSSDLYGKLCVVGLPDDRILIKKIRPGSREGLFRLLSEHEEPIEDVVIEWAAPVKTMVQR